MPIRFNDYPINELKPQSLLDEDTPIKSLELESFFMSLSLAFNDIKGMAIIEKDFLDKYERPDISECYHSGEWNGIKLQITKYFIGIFNEILCLIETKRKLLTSEQFLRYSNKLNDSEKIKWELILNVCGVRKSTQFDTEEMTKFLKFIKRIRNTVSFHYDVAGNSLIPGYRSHFYKSSGPGTNSAMYSYDNRDFYGVRFFYIDAALQSYLQDEINKQHDSEDVLKDTFEMVISISKIFSSLLRVYLEEKQPSHK